MLTEIAVKYVSIRASYVDYMYRETKKGQPWIQLAKTKFFISQRLFLLPLTRTNRNSPSFVDQKETEIVIY